MMRLAKASGLAQLGVGLTVAATISVLALLRAVSSRSGPIVLWTGLLSAGLISGGSLCLLLALVKYFQARRQPSTTPTFINTDSEYVAEYSWGDRGVGIGLTVFFGALVIVFLRAARIYGLAISAAAFSWAAIYLVHTTGTRIVFAKNEFVARISWFRQFSRRYSDVRRVSGKPGTLKLEFSDGRALKFHSGLGDPDVVIAYLQARCPESLKIG